MIAAAGIAALLVVGTLVVTAIVGNRGSGSSSPEGVVEQLADALRHSDPLAAARVLAPEEIRSLQGTVESAAKKAAELRLVETASAPLAGIDFGVDGLKLSTENLGAGYAKVTVDSGEFSASTRKAQFSPLMQKVLRQTDDTNSAHADLAKLAARDLPTFVITVKRDGRWYVSAAYTVLEYVREVNKLPAADFGSGARAIASLGAVSPDAAVQESVRALAQRDWSKLLTMAAPNEIPVYDYRAALTTLAARNVKAAGRSKPLFTIASMKTTDAVSGDTAKVTLHASGTTSGGKWSLDGGCYTYSATDSNPGDVGVSFPCGSGPVGLELLTLPVGGVSGASTVTATKQGDRWFVSPVGTVLDLVDRTIHQLDPRTAYSLLNIPNQIPPDGVLTLGTVVGLPGRPIENLRVLTFAGHGGQSLLGMPGPTSFSSADVQTGGGSVVVRVFAPDGSELPTAAGMLYGTPVVLPSDGTYTFVVVGPTSTTERAGVTVTIWNAADAPAAAREHNRSATCTYGVLSTSCESSGTSGMSGTSSSSSSGGESSVSVSVTTSVPGSG